MYRIRKRMNCLVAPRLLEKEDSKQDEKSFIVDVSALLDFSKHVKVHVYIFYCTLSAEGMGK